MAKELSKKDKRRKYGVSGQPIKATRVFARGMDHDFGTPAHAVLAINDKDGTFTSVNLYGPCSDCRTGKGYDPEGMTHPLPSKDSDRWKTWRKRGYGVVPVDQFDVIEPIKVEAVETKTVEAKAEKAAKS